MLRRRATFAASPDTANWVEDADAPSCLKCGVEFDVLVRRHHCRQCGGVFCAPCSSQRAPVAGFGRRPQRVCDDCLLRRVREARPGNAGPQAERALQPDEQDEHEHAHQWRPDNSAAPCAVCLDLWGQAGECVRSVCATCGMATHVGCRDVLADPRPAQEEQEQHRTGAVTIRVLSARLPPKPHLRRAFVRAAILPRAGDSVRTRATTLQPLEPDVDPTQGGQMPLGPDAGNGPHGSSLTWTHASLRLLLPLQPPDAPAPVLRVELVRDGLLAGTVESGVQLDPRPLMARPGQQMRVWLPLECGMLRLELAFEPLAGVRAVRWARHAFAPAGVPRLCGGCGAPTRRRCAVCGAAAHAGCRAAAACAIEPADARGKLGTLFVELVGAHLCSSACTPASHCRHARRLPPDTHLAVRAGGGVRLRTAATGGDTDPVVGAALAVDVSSARAVLAVELARGGSSAAQAVAHVSIFEAIELQVRHAWGWREQAAPFEDDSAAETLEVGEAWYPLLPPPQSLDSSGVVGEEVAAAARVPLSTAAVRGYVRLRTRFRDAGLLSALSVPSPVAAPRFHIDELRANSLRLERLVLHYRATLRVANDVLSWRRPLVSLAAFGALVYLTLFASLRHALLLPVAAVILYMLFAYRWRVSGGFHKRWMRRGDAAPRPGAAVVRVAVVAARGLRFKDAARAEARVALWPREPHELWRVVASGRGPARAAHATGDHSAAWIAPDEGEGLAPVSPGAFAPAFDVRVAQPVVDKKVEAWERSPAEVAVWVGPADAADSSDEGGEVVLRVAELFSSEAQEQEDRWRPLGVPAAATAHGEGSRGEVLLRVSVLAADGDTTSDEEDSDDDDAPRTDDEDAIRMYRRARAASRAVQNALGEFCGRFESARGLVQWANPRYSALVLLLLAAGAAVCALVPSHLLVFAYGVWQFSKVLWSRGPALHTRSLETLLSNVPNDRDLQLLFGRQQQLAALGERRRRARRRLRASWLGTARRAADAGFLVALGREWSARFVVLEGQTLKAWRAYAAAAAGQPAVEMLAFFTGLTVYSALSGSGSALCVVIEARSNAKVAEWMLELGSEHDKAALLAALAAAVDGWAPLEPSAVRARAGYMVALARRH